jgi:hypothetical protein
MKTLTTMEYVRFQVLTAASMKFRIVFWDVLILHGSTSQKTILNDGIDYNVCEQKYCTHVMQLYT